MRIDRPLLAASILCGLGDVAAAAPVATKPALKPSAAAKSDSRPASGTPSPAQPKTSPAQPKTSPAQPKTSPPVLPPVLPPPPLVTPAQEIVPASGGLGNDLMLAPLPPPLPPVRREPKQIRLGALIWAAGYLPALVAPLLLWPRVDSPDGPSALANYSLLVPLIGPYISAIAAPAQAEDGNGRAVMSAWSVPWLLTSGLLQTTGFVLLLRGALPRLRTTDDVALIPTGSGAAVIGRF